MMKNNLAQAIAFLVFFLGLVCITNAQAPDESTMESWADALSDKYKNIAVNMLRTQEFQDHLNSRASDSNQGDTYTVSARNGTAEVINLAQKLNDVIEEKTNIVKEMLSEMETSIQDYTRDDAGSPQYIDSSDDDDVANLNRQSNPRFPVEIDDSQSVIKFAPDVDRTDPVTEDHLFISQNLQSVFTNNFDKTTWQYFGSQQGFQRQYPGRAWTKNDDGSYQTFDPRLRPWYVGSTSGPKDVLIVFDKSGSMGQNNRMGIAREAAKTVLDTLTVRDYVNVVMFDDGADTPSCFPSTLVRAIPRNIDELKGFIDSTAPSGGTDFISAFEKAFDILETSQEQGQESTCETIILFMTDGQAPDPSSVIQDRLSSDLPVAIFSYAFGSGAGSDVPRKVACENKGIFAEIPDGGDLRGQMGTYYQYFAAGINTNEVLWTAPYYDASGLGLIITASAPVYDKRSDPPTLFGVVGTDIVVSELLFEAYTLKEQKSYAFVLNNEGQVLAHPLLKPPTDFDSSPVYTDIVDVEDSSEIQNIRSDMIQGNPGKKTGVSISRPLPVGDIQYEGVRTETYDASYYYRSINAGPFSVAVVLANDDQERFRWNSIDASNVGNSYYHRIDEYIPSQYNIQHLAGDSYITEDVSTFKVAPRGFEDPYRYEHLEETEKEVGTFTNYTNGKEDNPSLYVRSEVLTDIRLTQFIESPWIENYQDFVKFLYYGSENGMFRAYPGHNLPKNFDNTLRPWYLRAVAEENDILTVSTPYEDAAEPGRIIVTISKRISQPQSQSAISGVMGIDFNFDSFFSDIEDAVPECGEEDHDCYLVDNAGMVVAHQDFNDPNSDTSNVFMAEKEKLNDVATHLRDADALNEKTYADLQTLQRITYYRLETGATVFDVDNKCRSGTYGVAPISDTNLYLVVAYNQGPGVNNCPSFAPSQDPIDICSLPAEAGNEDCPVFDLSDTQLENLRGGSCDGTGGGGNGDDNGSSATVMSVVAVLFSVLMALMVSV